MKNTPGNADKLKTKFWKELSDAPIVFLQKDANPNTAIPMRAHLDENANHAIWFFLAADNDLAQSGAATATFASKSHGIFARFHGLLNEETDAERRKKHWGSDVESWFPGGMTSPTVKMVRMDLGMAEIWDHDLGVLATAKMAMGMDVRKKGKESHTETVL
jgi:general stress protein 26